MTIPLVLVAVTLLVLGIVLRRAQMGPRIGSALIVVGVAYGAAAVVVPRVTGADRDRDRDVRPTVVIVQPSPGAIVPANTRFPIEIKLSNAEISTSSSDTENGHLHIYVDGRLENMPFTTTAEVKLTPGEHEIKVEYVDWQHVSYFPKVQTSIKVEAGD
ncbi:MAG: hypothetical protein QOK47_1678 [Actinomycetota bacterium]|nr:hypothetical protein [Actinomycetota bacterium]